MGTLLFDVKPNDLPTYAAVGGLLGATALLAVAAPLTSAALLADPIAALRYE